MKKFKVFALVFAIMLSATGLGILFGSNQPASTQAKVSAAETTLAPGIYTVDSSGAKKMTKSWADIVTKNFDNTLSVNLSSSDGTYLVCGELPEGVARLNSMFAGKKWLTDIVFTSAFNTSKVTGMASLFSNCSSLTSLDLSSFNTSNLTNTYMMFNNCSKLTSLDLSNFNTSKVTYMDYMFNNCSKLTSLDLSNFDTREVTGMGGMFSNCSSLTSITFSSGFDTSKVIDMNHMFYNCGSLTSLDLSGFGKNEVTDMREMFENCSSLTSLDLSSFNTSNVTNMNSMFCNCSKLTSITFGAGFKTNYVEFMESMFYNCGSLTNLDLSSFNTSNVTSMYGMFSNCSKLTSLDLSSFNTSKVTDMLSMSEVFSGCTSLQNIKMPNTMNAESDITLSALSLPSQNASETAIKWYSLGNGETGGKAVVDSDKVSSYATKILTIDVNKDKSYAEIDNIIANATKPSTPETPSTGVVLDVVLPVASIVLVLASLVAVAFVGKKKKQF